MCGNRNGIPFGSHTGSDDRTASTLSRERNARRAGHARVVFYVATMLKHHRDNP